MAGEAVLRDENGVYTGPDKKTVKLRTPIKRDGGDELREITLQEPTARQLSDYFRTTNATSDEGVQATIDLISACGGVIPPDVEKLKQRDFDECSAFLALFTKALPPKSPV